MLFAYTRVPEAIQRNVIVIRLDDYGGTIPDGGGIGDVLAGVVSRWTSFCKRETAGVLRFQIEIARTWKGEIARALLIARQVERCA